MKDNLKGPQSIFSPRGKLALMFLKHYSGSSDNRLIEQLNANIDYQLFCGIYVPSTQRITNLKMVSSIRVELSEKLDIEKLQKLLAKYWRRYIHNLESITCDAICYVSYIRYPSVIQLLWESVSWSCKKLKHLSKLSGQTMMRTKYHKWSERYLEYSKMKKKTKKKAIPLNRSLLKLLYKINVDWNQ